MTAVNCAERGAFSRKSFSSAGEPHHHHHHCDGLRVTTDSTCADVTTPAGLLSFSEPSVAKAVEQQEVRQQGNEKMLLPKSQVRELHVDQSMLLIVVETTTVAVGFDPELVYFTAVAHVIVRIRRVQPVCFNGFSRFRYKIFHTCPYLGSYETSLSALLFS